MLRVLALGFDNVLGCSAQDRAAHEVYDPHRHRLGSMPPQPEVSDQDVGALDELFAERIGPESRIRELAPGTGVNLIRSQHVPSVAMRAA